MTGLVEAGTYVPAGSLVVGLVVAESVEVVSLKHVLCAMPADLVSEVVSAMEPGFD